MGEAKTHPSQGIALDLPFGKIEVKRRRETRDGRVKIKLSLLGVPVDRCGICLSQFKADAWAVLLPTCQHSFHADCIKSWLRRSLTCPLCRISLDS
ncbi:hypothetical protein SISNIDRAFT_407591 [Sistotremastrum niveocremeum HHB9708]|uniref:RING-type domain-containing protein n=1 Tax=Sistotremastrum niveocremeum HHB9708 TaxID=1314777 RepID=A0A164XT88_9AGAM|nr:hypothetical protein SISNIDRAFT_407591 [Sistotremastrum niveocremeum HHB9708]